MQHTMVVGTTEPSDFRLENNGEALDGTGYTVEIEFRNPAVSATAAWLSQANGTVRVTDVVGMSVLGKYSFRFKLTDGNGKIGYCPNDFSPDEWVLAKL